MMRIPRSISACNAASVNPMALLVALQRLECLQPVHICVAFDPHTDGTVNAKKKEGASNALTSLAGQTHHSHYGWRCPG
jgi:hypothetical protein